MSISPEWTLTIFLWCIKHIDHLALLIIDWFAANTICRDDWFWYYWRVDDDDFRVADIRE
jgi:hypothetical protein